MSVSEAKKQYYLEQHTASELLDIIYANKWENEVDLVNGGHLQLLTTKEEETAMRMDYEAAKAAGLDVDPVGWISKEEMFNVRIYVQVIIYLVYRDPLTYSFLALLFPDSPPQRTISGPSNLSPASSPLQTPPSTLTLAFSPCTLQLP
jgi:hypothetical protein